MQKVMLLQIVAILLPAFSVQISAPLQDLCLSASETALIDISEAFYGDSLDLQISGNTTLASIRPAVAIREVFRSPKARDSVLGPVFQLSPRLSFVLYSRRLIEVYASSANSTRVVWDIATEGNIEEVALCITGARAHLVYSSGGSLHIATVGGSHTTKLSGIALTHDSLFAVAASCSEIAVARRVADLNSTVTLYALSIDELTATVQSEHTTAGPVLDIMISTSVFILTPLGLYEGLGRFYHLDSDNPVTGKYLRFAAGNEGRTPMIIAERGVFAASFGATAKFFPRGQFVLHITSNPSLAAVLSFHNDSMVCQLYQSCFDAWVNSLAHIESEYQDTDVLDAKSVMVADLTIASFLVVSTKKGLYGYSVQVFPSTFMQVSHSIEPYSLELCALEYFHRSESVCQSILVSPHNRNSSEVQYLSNLPIRLHCPVTSRSHYCDFSLRGLISGPNYELSITMPQSEVELNVTADSLLTKIEEFLEIEKKESGKCTWRHGGQFTIIFLSSNTVELFLLSGGSRLYKAEEAVNFQECIGSEKVILLYGVIEGSLGAVYMLCNSALEKTELSNLGEKPIFHSFEDVMVVEFTQKLYVLHLDGNVFYPIEIPGNAHVLSVAAHNSHILLLVDDTVAIYLWCSWSKQYHLSAIRSIISHQAKISYYNHWLLSIDSTGLLALYYPASNFEFIELKSQRLSCTSPSFFTAYAGVVLVCEKQFYYLCPDAEVDSLVVLQQSLLDAMTVLLPSSLQTLHCRNTSCVLTTWTQTGLSGNSLTVRAQLASHQFAHGSIEIAGELRVIQKRRVVLVLPVVLELENAGAFAFANESYNGTYLQVPCDHESTVPLFSFFSGHSLNFSISSNSSTEDLTLSPSCKLQHRIPTTCPTTISPVIEMNLTFCVWKALLYVEKFECIEAKCTVFKTVKVPAASFLLSDLVSLTVLFLTADAVVVEVTGMTNDSVNYMERKFTIATIKNSGDLIIPNIQQSLVHFVSNNHFIQTSNSSAGRFDMIKYGLFLKHITVYIDDQGLITMSTQDFSDYSLVNIISVSSFTEANLTFVYVLTIKNRLFLFQLAEKLELVSIETLAIPQYLEHFNQYLAGKTLIEVTQSALQVYSLPSRSLMKEIYFPKLVDKALFNDLYLKLKGNQSLLGLYLGAKYSLIIDLMAPEGSNVMCAVSGRVERTRDSQVVLTNIREVLVYKVGAPALMVGKCQGELTERRIRISAENDNSEKAEIDIWIQRENGEERAQFRVLYGVIGVGVIALIIACKRKMRNIARKRAEIEMEQLPSCGVTHTR